MDRCSAAVAAAALQRCLPVPHGWGCYQRMTRPTVVAAAVVQNQRKIVAVVVAAAAAVVVAAAARGLASAS